MPSHLPFSRATLVRAAILLAGAVSPGLGATAAQAAIAGAQAQKATVVPALTSATIDSATPNAVDVCYDKPILPGTAQSAPIYLDGYRAQQRIQASSVVSLGADCVKASFAVAHLTPFTILTADSGAVTSSGGTNLADSTPLLGSNSHAGTRGVTSPPNLAGVASSTATSAGNQYIFTFDKDVGTPTNPAAFYVVGTDGRETDGQSAAPVASNAVAVTFAVADSGGQSTANAFLGGVRAGTIAAQYNQTSTNVSQSSLIPSTASTPPAEFAPYVTGAVLNAENPSSATSPGGTSVTFTFSQSVNPCLGSAGPAATCQIGGPTPALFKLELANGVVLSADSVTTQAAAPTTTVTANFTSLPYQSEFGVVAFADTGAAETYTPVPSPPVLTPAARRGAHAVRHIPVTSNGVANAASSAAVGGNSGAFAEGFTTAPDVTGITIAHNANGGSADVLSINLDDRTAGGLSGVTPNDFTYYDGTGAEAGAQPVPTACAVSQGSTAVTTGTPAPTPETVTCSYVPNALNGVAAVGFGPGAFVGTIAAPSAEDPLSVSQIDSPISSSAIARAYRINVARMKAHHRRGRHRAKP